MRATATTIGCHAETKTNMDAETKATSKLRLKYRHQVHEAHKAHTTHGAHGNTHGTYGTNGSHGLCSKALPKST